MSRNGGERSLGFRLAEPNRADRDLVQPKSAAVVLKPSETWTPPRKPSSSSTLSVPMTSASPSPPANASPVNCSMSDLPSVIVRAPLAIRADSFSGTLLLHSTSAHPHMGFCAQRLGISVGAELRELRIVFVVLTAVERLAPASFLRAPSTAFKKQKKGTPWVPGCDALGVRLRARWHSMRQSIAVAVRMPLAPPTRDA